MATPPEDDNPDILDLTDALVNPPQDEPQREEGDDPDPNVNDEAKPVVSFDGEEPEPEAESTVIREFRKREREKDKRIAELERQAAPKPVELGPKPTLESCDYDEERFETALDTWKSAKATNERQQATQAEETRKANESWQHDLNAFEQKKAALQFDDRDDAIESARSSLDLVQQAVVVKAAADPALFLYALSKSEAKRAEIAKIDDPIKLAAAVARMEGAVKVTNRKAPAPDRPERGSAQIPSGGADKELERLEKEADKPPYDRSKVIAYKRALKEKAAAEK